jgi:hypothetical protein
MEFLTERFLPWVAGFSSTNYRIDLRPIYANRRYKDMDREDKQQNIVILSGSLINSLQNHVSLEALIKKYKNMQLRAC